MRRLWVAVALAPLTFAASIAHAQTTVCTATTTPLVTSTAGNVTITGNEFDHPPPRRRSPRP